MPGDGPDPEHDHMTAPKIPMNLFAIPFGLTGRAGHAEGL